MASLGSLVVSLAMDTASFTSDIGKASQQMARLQGEAVRLAARVGASIGTLATAAVGYVQAANLVAQSIATYQDVADVMGDTAEAAASLQTAADLSGIALADVAAASVKLTAALSKTDDEAKGVGAGLGAIGIRVEEFKQLSPVEQIEAVAKALGRYKDGAEQTAVATAIFGKAGAQLLPFLKDLAEEGGRQITLTQQQIETADRYAKAQDRVRSQLSALGKSIVADSLPAVVAFSDALTRQVSALLEIDLSGKQLQRSDAVRNFARDSAVALAVVAESALGAAKLVRAIGGSFQSVGADIVALARAAVLTNPLNVNAENIAKLKEALDNRAKVAAEANQRYVDLWNYSGTAISDAVRRAFSAEQAILNRVQTDPRELARRGRPVEKPTIDISGLLTDANNAAKKAAAEAERVAEAYRSLSDSVGDAMANAQREIDNIAQLTPLQQLQVKLQDELLAGKMKYTEAQKASLAAQIQGLGLLDAEVAKTRAVIDAVNERAAARQRDYQAAEDAARANEQADRDRLRGLVSATPTGRLQNTVREIEFLNRMLEDGAKDTEVWAELMRNATSGLATTAQQSATVMDQFAKNAAQNFQSFLGQGLFDLAQGNFDNIGDAFKQMVTRLVAEAAAADLSRTLFGDLAGGEGQGFLREAAKGFSAWISGLFSSSSGVGAPSSGSGGSGSWFSTLLSAAGTFFAGSGANGMQIPPGKWGWVGENGPEPAFGGRTGMTVASTGGGGPVYHIHVQAQPGMTRASAMQQGAQIGLGMQRALARNT